MPHGPSLGIHGRPSLGIHGPGLDLYGPHMGIVNLPNAGSGLDIHGPEIGVDLHGPGLDLHGPHMGIDVSLPHPGLGLGLSLHGPAGLDIHGPAIGLDLHGPVLDVHGPAIDIHGPTLHAKPPEPKKEKGASKGIKPQGAAQAKKPKKSHVMPEAPKIGAKVDVKMPKMSVTGEIMKAGMKIETPKLSVSGPKISVEVPKDTSTYYKKEKCNYPTKVVKMKDYISQDFKAPIYDVKEVPRFGIYKKK